MKPQVKPAFVISRCPTCGSSNIAWVCERWTYQTDRGDITTPPVPHWYCSECHERLFDRVSHEVLDPWRAARKRSTNAPSR